jgi:hypothetical protein
MPPSREGTCSPRSAGGAYCLELAEPLSYAVLFAGGFALADKQASLPGGVSPAVRAFLSTRAGTSLLGLLGERDSAVLLAVCLATDCLAMTIPSDRNGWHRPFPTLS